MVFKYNTYILFIYYTSTIVSYIGEFLNISSPNIRRLNFRLD